MQVVALVDHFHDSTLRLKGERFEHTGKLHAHIKPAKKEVAEETAQEDPAPGAGGEQT